MPVQGWYLDDETYRRLLDEASKEGRKPGEVLSNLVRTELSKRESEESRPKVCGRCQGSLEWHLTAQDHAELYAVCVVCGEKYRTKEIYRTGYLH